VQLTIGFIMKYIFTLMLFLLGLMGESFGQNLYYETFADITDGATSDNGSTGWDTDTSPGFPDLFSKQSQGSLNFFQATDTDGDVKWFTDLIDISGYPAGVTISYEIAETGNQDADDYIGLYYNTDGGEGADNTINIDSDNFGNSFTEVSSGTITGTNIQVVIIVNNDEDNENHYFRNVEVESLAGNTLYSTGSGDWNDGSIWSTVGYGGASCNCSPNESTPINIGNSNTVALLTDVSVNDLTIDNTGSLEYTDDDLEINVENDGIFTVNNGGTFDENGQDDADLDFEGGSGSSQLVVNSGASFNIENIYMFGSNNLNISGDGDVNISDDFQFNSNGTVNNNNTGIINIGFDLNFNTDNSTFNNSGIITVSDDYTSGSGDNNNLFTNNSGATLTIGGDINLTNGNMTINNSGVINLNGDFLDGTIDTGSDFNNLDGGEWNWAGTSYDASVGFILDCTGGTNDFNYTSGSDQPIIDVNYVNLGMEGSGNNALQDDVLITGILTLSSSTLSLGAFDFTLDDNASISGGSSASFVVTDGVGVLTQNNLGSGGRTGSILFPVGRLTTDYTPLSIDNSSGTVDDFSLRVCSNVYEEGGCETGTLVSDLILDRTWFITEGSAGGSDVDVTFQWNASNEVGSFNRADIDLIHYTGSTWEALTNTSATGSDPYVATISGVSDFSPFTVQDAASPLPVELAKFSGEYVTNNVEINWVTASELNNDYFIIERSSNAKDFEEITRVDGHGTTNEVISYEYIDHEPYGGNSYYRLTQVDFDGTSKTYKPIKVYVSLNGNLLSSLDPMPSNGDYINLYISGFDKSLTTNLKIVSVKGEVMHLEEIYLDKDIGFEKKIDFQKKLSPGMYILSVNTPEPIIKRIMVK